MKRLLRLRCSIILRLLLVYPGLAITACAQAQLCSGSLGDPVVNITFGAGHGPGPALAAATTSYGYVADPCPVNGYYTLLNSGIECNYGWHVLQRDHTGDVNGYCMLADASFETGDFYVDTVRSLCSGTTYEFAAWMLNMKYVLQGTRPNITFSIETETGQVLQRYNSGDLPVEPTVQWKQYGFYFTTPADAAKIVLRMTNNAPGGDGNDLALDDITFRPCGKRITSVIAGSNSDTVNICTGNISLYTLSATVSSGYISPVYQWQISIDKGMHWSDIAGAIGISFLRQPTGTGIYWYRFTVAEASNAGITTCRIASNALVIHVHAKPVANAGADRIAIRGGDVLLNGSAQGEELSISWQPDAYINNTSALTPVVSPLKDISYTLTAASAYGCSDDDTVMVKIIAGPYIPSAFTPNGDGKNDSWKIAFSDAEVNVFNRYGQLVYYGTGPSLSWDGQYKGNPQPAGSYVYIIHFKMNENRLKGTVTIVR